MNYHNNIVTKSLPSFFAHPNQSPNMTVGTTNEEKLPDRDVAGTFYMKYEPKKLLGTGASSTVRLCVEKDTQKEFAVKIIDINSGVDYPDVIRDECRLEVEIHQKLNDHSNIIKLYEVFETDAYIFLILEKCQNGELFDFLNTSQNLSEKRTRSFMRQIFSALNFIHSKGIVHRDMKPENILLDDDMNAKISDLGLACYSDDRDELSLTKGTPIYLAPEVLRVGYYENEPPYTSAVDMWACGVIMYTCLVGRPPFWHRKEHLMLRSIMEGNYLTSVPEWEDMGEQPKDLIKKLLVVDPTQRLTAEEALQHSFFLGAQELHANILNLEDMKPLKFNARHVYRAACWSIRFIYRLQRQRTQIPSITRAELVQDPYSNKRIRKLIDLVAFNVYSHWIKKGEDQNRAALFEIAPKRELLVNA